jgi:hypothetical protein
MVCEQGNLLECKGNLFLKLGGTRKIFFGEVQKTFSGVVQGLRIVSPGPYPSRDPSPRKFVEGG